MISRYVIILLVVSATVPAFADDPVKTDCSGSWTVYTTMICQINDIRDFFITSMHKQDVILSQNTQIEKLLIQQNKLQAYTFCGGTHVPYEYDWAFTKSEVYPNTFYDCVSKVLNDTK
jgi:hypothetical protein